MLLQADNLCKSFGAQRVLDGISFSADSGEVVGILGANGAGKTTLLRIVNLILAPDSGSLLFDGHPMTRTDLAAVGYLPEERGLYRRMRVGEQVVYLARLKGMSRADARSEARAWFDRLGAADWWHRPANRLSKGMQQKVQFISTVVHRPRLLVLDEPFSGFDADNAAMLRSEIERLSHSGTAILLSTHNTEAAASLCHKTLQL
ncbi:MAG: ATP-binding cassette domain-containing protein [Bacteroidales bacterium]|nr:ATP-binding cassette domain-containing protein [Bacteroidales bacterium]